MSSFSFFYNKHLHNTDQQNKGFSLVEIAVVIIIIGILVAGVIKGKDLVIQSRLQSYTEDFLKLRAHLALFKDQYGTWPSDVTTAECTALGWGTTCGIVTTRAKEVANNANNYFWHQMLEAFPSFVNGEEATAGSSREFYPAIWSFRDKNNTNQWYTGNAATNLWGKARGNYIITSSHTDYTGSFKTSEALAIDRKIDDGLANSGAIYGFSSTAASSDKCSAGFAAAASTDDYGDGADSGAEDNDACGLHIFLDEWE